MATSNGISHFTPKTKFPVNPVSKSKPSKMPRIVSMAQNQSYWAAIEAEIETYLKKSIPIRSPESVFEPMHHLTFAAPPTTAPALCVAACELVGGDRSHAMAAAAAVHLIHAAAHAHEHLPLTDRTRFKPPVQHKYDPNIELLTGDGIIPFGMELVARSMEPGRVGPDRVLRVIIEISRSTGSQGVVDGQYHELGMISGGTDWESVEYVCRKKEGELHACGAACGAILGGGAEEEIEKLRSFGVYAGMVRGMAARNGSEEKIRELKDLALKQLESFRGKRMAELISSLVEPSRSYAPHLARD